MNCHKCLTPQSRETRMIRFKAFGKGHPNWLLQVDYHMEDIPRQAWYCAFVKMIDLIKKDSPSGWRLILKNFLNSLKTSVFYPVMASFSDWKESYCIGSPAVKFYPQERAVEQYFKLDGSRSVLRKNSSLDFDRAQTVMRSRGWGDAAAGTTIRIQAMGADADGYSGISRNDLSDIPISSCAQCSTSLLPLAEQSP